MAEFTHIRDERLRLVIVDYDPRWPVLYDHERDHLQHVLGPLALAIEHIGSTAVPGLAAKAIIDIMVGMRNLEDVDAFKTALEGFGYTYHFTGEDWSHFSKVVLPKFEAYNLHIHPLGSARWERQLLFRDFLRAHADVADAYAALKRELASRKLPLRTYAEAKTAFVEDVLARARRDQTDG